MEAARLSDRAIRAALRGRGRPRAAAVPVGSTEQHGAHLPVSTDADLAAHVAARLCRDAGFLLCPAVRYGVSREHAPMFHASVRPATLRRSVSEVAASLAAAGLRDVFAVNGHHGNRAALAGLRRAGGARVHVIHYWEHLPAAFDHAGRTETSLMLAAAPRSVDMSLARRGFVPRGPAEARRASAAAARSFASVAPSGVWGDPRGATAAEGRRMLAAAARSILAECLSRLGGGAAR